VHLLSCKLTISGKLGMGMVKETVAEIGWGLQATFYRVANIVTVVVKKTALSFGTVGESYTIGETCPSGYRPIDTAMLTVQRNYQQTIMEPIYFEFKSDGRILITNNNGNYLLHQGMATWLTKDDFPN
jgi:hypothetical protein